MERHLLVVERVVWWRQRLDRRLGAGLVIAGAAVAGRWACHPGRGVGRDVARGRGAALEHPVEVDRHQELGELEQVLAHRVSVVERDEPLERRGQGLAGQLAEGGLGELGRGTAERAGRAGGGLAGLVHSALRGVEELAGSRQPVLELLVSPSANPRLRQRGLLLGDAGLQLLGVAHQVVGVLQRLGGGAGLGQLGQVGRGELDGHHHLELAVQPAVDRAGVDAALEGDLTEGELAGVEHVALQQLGLERQRDRVARDGHPVDDLATGLEQRGRDPGRVVVGGADDLLRADVDPGGTGGHGQLDLLVLQPTLEPHHQRGPAAERDLG